jgi:hypothetical protein
MQQYVLLRHLSLRAAFLSIHFAEDISTELEKVETRPEILGQDDRTPP